jgi:hypothetical protein
MERLNTALARSHFKKMQAIDACEFEEAMVHQQDIENGIAERSNLHFTQLQSEIQSELDNIEKTYTLKLGQLKTELDSGRAQVLHNYQPHIARGHSTDEPAFEDRQTLISAYDREIAALESDFQRQEIELAGQTQRQFDLLKTASHIKCSVLEGPPEAVTGYAQQLSHEIDGFAAGRKEEHGRMLEQGRAERLRAGTLSLIAAMESPMVEPSAKSTPAPSRAESSCNAVFLTQPRAFMRRRTCKLKNVS